MVFTWLLSSMSVFVNRIVGLTLLVGDLWTQSLISNRMPRWPLRCLKLVNVNRVVYPRQDISFDIRPPGIYNYLCNSNNPLHWILSLNEHGWVLIQSNSARSFCNLRAKTGPKLNYIVIPTTEKSLQLTSIPMYVIVRRSVTQPFGWSCNSQRSEE